MFTDRRLTEAYKKARVEYFDEDSKYVFFSDVHRGDGSMSDEFTRNRNIYLHALKHYYENDFTYIEAGDGDEMLEYSDFKYTKNAHREVFDIIKKFFDKKRLIRLYGNHDIFLKNKKFVEENYYTNYDEYNEVFFDFLKGLKPVEALVLRNLETGQEILTIHGHQGDAPNDQFAFFTMLSLKFFWRFLHGFGIRNPSSPIKNVSKRHKIEKNFNKWIKKNKMMLICGHTHRFKYPKDKELPYFNTGCCVYPTFITAIELTEGKIQLVRWAIKVSPDGVLTIEKEVMRGPEPVEEFDIR
ncbi:metallophosphoesterase family protein [Carnobacterium sp. CS13]|uniref:metallophosphoesterase n=1 Tax=Carnobacterium sp. CS13 TaxID=2800128 RepID=UPI001913EB07|nr:metallophosphoesterase [Carnobacterium sp. CS13]QQP69996.1 metallophosphoesterase family protein [Carnobacterium sp. CS13]